jgi:excisionase family DNA binding protein
LEEDDNFMTYGQVATMLGVRRGTIYSWVHRREIPFLRIGRRLVRFSKRRVAEWLTTRAVEPRARGTSETSSTTRRGQ